MSQPEASQQTFPHPGGFNHNLSNKNQILESFGFGRASLKFISSFILLITL